MDNSSPKKWVSASSISRSNYPTREAAAATEPPAIARSTGTGDLNKMSRGLVSAQSFNEVSDTVSRAWAGGGGQKISRRITQCPSFTLLSFYLRGPVSYTLPARLASAAPFFCRRMQIPSRAWQIVPARDGRRSGR